MKRSMLLFFLFPISIAAYAGPFGLTMGASLAELNKQIKLKPESLAVYSAPSLPNPHPDFDDYRLVITPDHGLCKVIAWSRLIETSVYGTQAASKFTSIEEALTTKYGNPKRLDFLMSGSIWNEQRDWMMGLLKKERTLMSYWTNKEHELPDKVSTVMLETIALDKERALVHLIYEFKNSSQCTNWIKSQKGLAL